VSEAMSAARMRTVKSVGRAQARMAILFDTLST
jgi:hypothetical protein